MKRTVLGLALLVASCGGTRTGVTADPANSEHDHQEPIGDVTESKAPEAIDGNRPDTAMTTAAGAVTLESVTCNPTAAVDQAAVDALFTDLLPEFEQCYAAALELAPGVEGNYVVQVVFTVDSGRGRSDGYFFVATSFVVKGFQDCLGNHLLRAELASLSNDRLVCELKLNFSAEQ